MATKSKEKLTTTPVKAPPVPAKLPPKPAASAAPKAAPPLPPPPPPSSVKKINLEPLKKANVPVFFVVGGPGSGKGTQCEKIVAKYGLSHLSSGDLLRAEVKSNSPRGAQLNALMAAGQLVPNDIVLELIKEAMLKEVAKGSKGFLLDGYPREAEQGEAFEKAILEVKLVVYFDVKDETLIQRLLGRAKTSGRADDNLETIKKRLETFHKQTTAVIEQYEKKGKLAKISGEDTVDAIFGRVVEQLDKAMGLSKPSCSCSCHQCGCCPRPVPSAKALDLTPLKAAALPIFFIVGGPGSGKGTQCEKIVAKYGLSHLSSGDLLRAEVKSNSPRGAQLQAQMAAGQLVGNEVVLELIKEAMLKEVAKGSKGFLLDGYPREAEQGEAFEKEILEVKLVIYFDVKDETLTQRLLNRAKTSGRADDNLETIKKRLETFHKQTTAVISQYEKKGKLVKISGEAAVDAIFGEVTKCLDKVCVAK